MRMYRTLVQPLFTQDIDLEDYFRGQGIDYKLGADWQEDLTSYGFTIDRDGLVHPLAGNRALVATYIVLLDESDLSAIKLSIPEIQIIRNRSWYNFVNKIRGYCSWFLN